jgi:hypothetical protein
MIKINIIILSFILIIVILLLIKLSNKNQSNKNTTSVNEPMYQIKKNDQYTSKTSNVIESLSGYTGLSPFYSILSKNIDPTSVKIDLTQSNLVVIIPDELITDHLYYYSRIISIPVHYILPPTSPDDETWILDNITKFSIGMIKNPDYFYSIQMRIVQFTKLEYDGRVKPYEKHTTVHTLTLIEDSTSFVSYECIISNITPIHINFMNNAIPHSAFTTGPLLYIDIELNLKNINYINPKTLERGGMPPIPGFVMPKKISDLPINVFIFELTNTRPGVKTFTRLEETIPYILTVRGQVPSVTNIISATNFLQSKTPNIYNKIVHYQNVIDKLNLKLHIPTLPLLPYDRSFFPNKMKFFKNQLDFTPPDPKLIFINNEFELSNIVVYIPNIMVKGGDSVSLPVFYCHSETIKQITIGIINISNLYKVCYITGGDKYDVNYYRHSNNIIYCDTVYIYSGIPPNLYLNSGSSSPPSYTPNLFCYINLTFDDSLTPTNLRDLNIMAFVASVYGDANEQGNIETITLRNDTKPPKYNNYVSASCYRDGMDNSISVYSPVCIPDNIMSQINTILQQLLDVTYQPILTVEEIKTKIANLFSTNNITMKSGHIYLKPIKIVNKIINDYYNKISDIQCSIDPTNQQYCVLTPTTPLYCIQTPIINKRKELYLEALEASNIGNYILIYLDNINPISVINIDGSVLVTLYRQYKTLDGKPSSDTISTDGVLYQDIFKEIIINKKRYVCISRDFTSILLQSIYNPISDPLLFFPNTTRLSNMVVYIPNQIVKGGSTVSLPVYYHGSSYIEYGFSIGILKIPNLYSRVTITSSSSFRFNSMGAKESNTLLIHRCDRTGTRPSGSPVPELICYISLKFNDSLPTSNLLDLTILPFIINANTGLQLFRDTLDVFSFIRYGITFNLQSISCYREGIDNNSIYNYSPICISNNIMLHLFKLLKIFIMDPITRNFEKTLPLESEMIELFISNNITTVFQLNVPAPPNPLLLFPNYKSMPNIVVYIPNIMVKGGSKISLPVYYYGQDYIVNLMLTILKIPLTQDFMNSSNTSSEFNYLYKKVSITESATFPTNFRDQTITLTFDKKTITTSASNITNDYDNNSIVNRYFERLKIPNGTFNKPELICYINLTFNDNLINTNLHKLNIMPYIMKATSTTGPILLRDTKVNADMNNYTSISCYREGIDNSINTYSPVCISDTIISQISSLQLSSNPSISIMSNFYLSNNITTLYKSDLLVNPGDIIKPSDPSEPSEPIKNNSIVINNSSSNSKLSIGALVGIIVGSVIFIVIIIFIIIKIINKKKQKRVNVL